MASPTIQSALDSAESAGDDEVRIKTGSYTGNFDYDPTISNSGALLIAPVNTSPVTLRSITSSATTLTIQQDNVDSDTVVRDLTIEAPDSGGGLLTYGTALRTVIRSASGAQGATGLRLIGSAEARDVDVRMTDNGGPANRGVETDGTSGNAAGPGTVITSYVESEDGMLVTNGLTLTRSRLITSQRGINVLCAGSVDIDNVAHTVTGGFGMEATSTAQCGPNAPANVDVRHLTLISEAPSAGPALQSDAGSGGNARITLRSSIVRGFADVVHVQHGGGVGTTSEIHAGHSLVDLTLVQAGSAAPAVDDGGNFVGDPLFRDAAARDYQPLWPSPVIDAGHPLPVAAGESTLDLVGEQRLFDGDGDGVARRDAGAFEYVGVAPKVSVSPNPAVVGQPVTFDASQSHHLYGPLNYAWNWDDGGSAVDVASAAHTFSTPGTHTGTVSIGDGTGSPRAEKAFSVVVNAPPSNPGTPSTPSTTSTASPPLSPVNPSAAPGAVVADTASPSLTAKLLKKRFGRKKGGTLQLQLSEAATVSVVVERCTKRKGRRCTRYKQASSKSVKSPPGTSRVALKRLRTGLHRVRVRATDAAGNRSPERIAAFTVTR